MTIRFKMTTIVVAVLLVANTLLSFVALRYLGSVWLGEVQTRVQRNLNSARAAYDKRVELIAAYLRGTARDQRLITTATIRDLPELEALLTDIHYAGSVDFVTLLDPTGRVTCRAHSPQRGDDLANDPLVSMAIREGQLVSGTAVLSRDRLLAEGGDLADRARFQLVPTPAARPTSDTQRCDGMVIAAIVPVRNAQGELQAFLYGGNLLNRSYDLVDAIKREVFPSESYRGRDIGTVTIFQGDLRISTNVTMDDHRLRAGFRSTWPRDRRALCGVAPGTVCAPTERHHRRLPGHRAGNHRGESGPPVHCHRPGPKSRAPRGGHGPESDWRRYVGQGRYPTTRRDGSAVSRRG